MLCLIADIKTSVPAAGGLASRCADYLIEGDESNAEIVIDETSYNCERWNTLNHELAVYMESAAQFYTQLLDHEGMMLHASATVIDGEAYLFAGQCCIGKSTHAGLLKQRFPDAVFINDDKPALRRVNGVWIAYGTPWCGKNSINTNASAPVRAITLLNVRRDRNLIRPADPMRMVSGLLPCICGRTSKRSLLKVTPLLNSLIAEVPIYEMDSLADDAAAEMAYNAMKYGI